MVYRGTILDRFGEPGIRCDRCSSLRKSGDECPACAHVSDKDLPALRSRIIMQNRREEEENAQLGQKFKIAGVIFFVMIVILLVTSG